MNEQHQLNMPTQYWYGKPDNINHLFYGVFEGGGAKGVAYVGALGAMAEKRCWFRGVAGASAGAITAALVAAGVSPEEMETQTDSALKQLQTRAWAGIRRLQNATGYFPSDGLRDWLNDLLKKQVARKTGDIPDAAVTFRELYDATGIELNIVAADLSLKSQMILSHNETPNCAVADAVVASSSIPFAFPSRLLQVADGENGNQVTHHTIVDGGVWSNFPMYIFEDDAFREFYKRVPKKLESCDILGFILKETDEQAPPCGEDIKFVEAVPASEFSAREWSYQKPTEDSVQPALTSKIGAWLLFPFYLLGRLAEWNSGIERGRWPTPKSRSANYLVYSINGLLGGIHPLFFGILAFVLVAIGAWEVTTYLIAEQLRVIPATDWTQPLSYPARLVSVLLVLLVVAVAVLLPFATLLGVVANRILLRASRRILYGLVSTYVAGSGAPAWAAMKRNIVFLPIPPTVNTLSFEMDPTQRKDLIESARQATLTKLAEVLSEDRNSA
jgi:predicted acylesterase/phospholipase RssA